MKIEFLGHAGFWIRIGKIEIVIDPWLIASSFSHPILESMVPKLKTIDYLIPEPVRTIEEIDPDIILMSHYHTHHAPKQEIEYWLNKSSKKITLLGPTLNADTQNEFLDEFKQKFPQHTFKMYDEDGEFRDGTTTIKVLTHPLRGHLAFLIESASQRFLHLADASISRIAHDRRLDPMWFKYKDMAIDFLVLTVADISSRIEQKDGAKYIVENGFLGPVEAANLVQMINPKNVAVMGIFNFSIWKNRNEYGYPYAEVENYFLWGLSHLAPHIGVHVLRPGNEYQIVSEELQMKINKKKSPSN